MTVKTLLERLRSIGDPAPGPETPKPAPYPRALAEFRTVRPSDARLAELAAVEAEFAKLWRCPVPRLIHIAESSNAIRVEFSRLAHYRDTYGVSFKTGLMCWLAGVPIHEAIARVKQKAGAAS